MGNLTPIDGGRRGPPKPPGPPDDGSKRRHFSVEKLSAEAKALVDAGLRDGVPYDDIVAEVKEVTGEKVSRSAISRYWRGHAAAQIARTRELNLQASKMLEALREKPTGDLADAIRDLIGLGLMERSHELAGLDPARALVEQRHRERLRLEERELALKERELELGFKTLEQRASEAERKYALLEKKSAAFAKAIGGEAEKAKRKGKVLDPETIERIKREVFGL